MIPRAQPAKADSNTGSNHSAFRLTDGLPRSALYKNIEGGYNTADGMFALLSNTNGLGSTAIGYKALLNTTTGTRNTAVGQWALYNNTTGTET